MLAGGRHLPPDPAAGDESTLGGYTAVHSRPPAFEGPDGLAYSVGICVDDVADATAPDAAWAGFLIYVRWRRIGESAPEGHLETDYLAFAGSEGEARAELEALSLVTVQETLNALVHARALATNDGGGGGRKWWDAMRDERSGDDA